MERVGRAFIMINWRAERRGERGLGRAHNGLARYKRNLFLKVLLGEKRAAVESATTHAALPPCCTFRASFNRKIGRIERPLNDRRDVAVGELARGGDLRVCLFEAPAEPKVRRVVGVENAE